MEFIGRIAVQKSKKERTKKTLLTIGLAVLAISIVIELMLGSFTSLSLIIPLIYLLNLRNKMGKKILFKDVIISAVADAEKFQLEVSNCEYQNNTLYSARFIIPNDNNISITYDTEDEKTIINCMAKKDLLFGNTIIPSIAEQRYNIELFLKRCDVEKITSEFLIPLYIK